MKLAIIIIRNKKKIIKTFNDAEVLFSEWEKIKKRYKSSPLYIVNRTKATAPPPDLVILRGYVWCPYCSDLRHFVFNAKYGVKRCEICDISDNDYYVKKYLEVRSL